QKPLGTLSKTVGDAKAVAAVLRQHGDFEDLQILTGSVTREALETALSRLLLEQSDRHEALIYYTGHAVVVKGAFGKKRGYLALSNSKLKVVNGEITGIEDGIALDDLSGLTGQAVVSNLVMILDCCHSETLLEETQGYLQRSIATQSFTEVKKDYFLVSACRQFQEAYAYKSQEYSVFTGALLASLGRERANDRGIVNASAMYGYIVEQLRGSGQEAVDLGLGGGSIRMVDYRTMAAASERQVSEENPYQGLLAFEPQTAKFFFGRDTAWQRLLTKLQQRPFAFVVGVSGSGKSSLVRAKLWTHLEAQGYQVLVMKPWSNPMQRLKDKLTETLADRAVDIAAVEACMEEEGVLAAIDRFPFPKLFLLVDQFEEVFTVCTRLPERQQFIQSLVAIMERSSRELMMVATMRADFLGDCGDYQLDAVINDQMVWVSTMSPAELQEVIVQPAAVQGYTVQNDLVREILREVKENPQCLPLLEFGLQELWERRDRQAHHLTLDHYEAMGGLVGSIDRHAETLFSQQSEQGQAWMQQIFLKLVRFGQQTQDTRQREKRRVLLALGADVTQNREIEGVLRVLEGTKGRLLVASEEEGKAIVDLAHEALLEGWKRFAGWRQENRDLRRLVQRVEDAQKEWRKKGQGDGYLLQGGLLAEVREQWQNLEAEFSPATQAYFQASDGQEKHQIASLERALTEAKLREEAMQILNLTSVRPQPDTAAKAIQAVGTSYEKLQGRILTPVQANLTAVIDKIRERCRIQGHTANVYSVAFSPDGSRIVSGSSDNTIRLWDLQGNPIGEPFQGHT
ncbi:caspase family protein, partial [Prochlorothrix hollandica]|uniref:nSTAND1 domain-containing NTPase n=1 Tax=Prochlorothrix hollandica TaxID=1223 RepID=UPI0033411A14